jgi:hypothetical protein
VDDHIAPSEMLHIVDADSSQTLAIHEARRGRDLVIRGPPGTGKSQTIANIIASAVADGKTLLFVAEKMAALDVVKRRLDQAGVGDACLELHSNKSNKRSVLAELQRTWDLGAPRRAFGRSRRPAYRSQGQAERPPPAVAPPIRPPWPVALPGHGPIDEVATAGPGSRGHRAQRRSLMGVRPILVPAEIARGVGRPCPGDGPADTSSVVRHWDFRDLAT